jgi:quercetin dioxygenase-like cupin family protein
MTDAPIRAEALLSTADLRADLPFFHQGAADAARQHLSGGRSLGGGFLGPWAPRSAEPEKDGAQGSLRLLTDDPDFAGGQRALVSPGGTRVEVDELDPPLVPAPDRTCLRGPQAWPDQAPWVIGRAGMQYRDLVPSRLGGAMIASHIRIPDGGPVPDMVHYHRVGFQLIFCIKGWVDVLYEDQGGLRRLTAGDCFIQPPQIRHRVVEASEGIEVIEIGVPAEHVTEIDHECGSHAASCARAGMDGQRFVQQPGPGCVWAAFRLPGLSSRADTDRSARSTQGRSLGRAGGAAGEGSPPGRTHCRGNPVGFRMLQGGSSARRGRARSLRADRAGDAFVIPPGMRTRWAAPSEDVEVLEVALPGRFGTRVG